MQRTQFLQIVVIALLGFALTTSNARAQEEKKDWLLDPVQYVADVQFDSEKNELKLTNGLVERRILLAPNAVSVSLRNLVSGEEMIRALSPEARVTIDGESYPVGGIDGGAPVANYWREEWAKNSKVLPNAYSYQRYEVGDIEERFEYLPRPEWLSRDVVWPPKGKRVTMFYMPPKVHLPVTAGDKLFEESFHEKVDQNWRVRVGQNAARASVENEGKPGEIYTPPEVCAYYERDWIDDAASVSVTLDVGDDDVTNSWGPGLAFVFGNHEKGENERVVSVVARPNSRQFELCVDGRETLIGSFEREKDVTFTVRIQKNEISSEAPYALLIDALADDGKKTDIGRVEVPSLPSVFRVGRVGKGGYGKDYPNAEDSNYKRAHLKNVAFYGPVPEERLNDECLLPNIEVRYEIYDGAPLISKRIAVRYPENALDKTFCVDRFVNEELRLVEPESVVDDYTPCVPYNLFLMSDYVYGGMKSSGLYQNEAFRLKVDKDYPTQVNYARKTLCLLECAPEIGPAQIVDKQRDFVSNTIYEVLLDNYDRERRGLAQRRVMRILAPWTAENPLMFHKVKSSPNDVIEGIEQCKETGFEVLIMSFGSGFNMESKDEGYRDTYRKLSEKAKEANVALGGYSLTSSRGAAVKSDNVVNPSPRFGVGPCLGSSWGKDYLQTLKDTMEKAQFGVFENDGPYPGDFCESVNHPGHVGKNDSVWNQWEAQADLYRWCRARGIYINQPDGYFLTGGNKTGMGYRETNWSLPRAEQVIIERQNVYDGTWTKSSSLGWMFVPLSQYHGGGAAATIEPLKDHLEHYDARFADLIGAGVQACWRGPRLYDSEETKNVVLKWTNFYKKNRRILDADIIHMRRPTGRDWDGFVHVDPDPDVQTRALAFFYNPTLEKITREITVPLYYSGLKNSAVVRIGNDDLTLGAPFNVRLDEKGQAVLEITIPAEKYVYATFEAADVPNVEQ